MLSFNGRQILKAVIEAPEGITAGEIQERFGIYRKNTYAEMEQLSAFLEEHGARIKSVKNKGFQIEVMISDRYHKFQEEFLYINRRNQYLYFEKNYLAYQILFKLVHYDRYISVDELAEIFHYSRGTISKSLKVVKSIVSKYHCKLVSRPNYGMRLSGGERHKRIFILFVDKISWRLKVMYSNVSYDTSFIDKEKFSASHIEGIIVQCLNRRGICIPYLYLTKLKLYIIISQTRSEFYDDLSFSPEQRSCLETSGIYSVGAELATCLNDAGYCIREKDMLMFTAMLLGYVTRREPEAGDDESCQDAEEVARYIEGLYFGAGQYLDGEFIHEFTCYLQGMKARLLYELHIDDESIYQIKQDGSFTAEVCRDIAVFIGNKYHIRLPESEILSFSYIVHNSFQRYEKREAKYKAVLISRYGIHYARNVIGRIMQDYKKEFYSITPMEFSEIAVSDILQYHFIITDIEQERYDFVEIPLLTLDFFREPAQSRLLNRFLSVLTALELSDIIKDENIIRNTDFANKLEVYQYLAGHYVSSKFKKEFIEESVYLNGLLTDERCNRVASVSVDSRFYSKREIVILLNASPFIWDNEPVQVIVFLNRKQRNYIDLKVLNLIMTSFMHANLNLPKKLMTLNAQEIIEFIIQK